MSPDAGNPTPWDSRPCRAQVQGDGLRKWAWVGQSVGLGERIPWTSLQVGGKRRSKFTSSVAHSWALIIFWFG